MECRGTCHLSFSKSREAGIEAELYHCCPTGCSSQAAIFPGSEPGGFKTEADTSRTNERAHEKCVLCRNFLCAIPLFKADSGSLRELSYSVWLDSFSQMPHVARESPTASFQSTPASQERPLQAPGKGG